jgi:hypothetical protein
MKKHCVILLVLLANFELLAQEVTAKFSYQYHSDQAKAGTFVFDAPDDQFDFEAPASAGYLDAANDPYRQATKNTGPIPNGTWKIYAIKNKDKFILRLKPTDDVVITTRDGFLIHGVGPNRSPDQSSHGCIIIEDGKYRKKLMEAFQKYGEITLIVTNIVTGDPTREG